MPSVRTVDVSKLNHVASCSCPRCRAGRDHQRTLKRGERPATYRCHPDQVRLLRIGADGSRHEIDAGGTLVPVLPAPFSITRDDLIQEPDGRLSYQFDHGRKLTFAVSGPAFQGPFSFNCYWALCDAPIADYSMKAGS